MMVVAMTIMIPVIRIMAYILYITHYKIINGRIIGKATIQ